MMLQFYLSIDLLHENQFLDHMEAASLDFHYRKEEVLLASHWTEKNKLLDNKH